jgi:hypothetical protein
LGCTKATTFLQFIVTGSSGAVAIDGRAYAFRRRTAYEAGVKGGHDHVAQDPQFVDEFKRIGLANGVVRIELGVLPPADEGQQPALESTGTLVMSIDGFLRSAATIEAFLKQLAAKGIVRHDPTARDKTVPQ